MKMRRYSLYYLFFGSFGLLLGLMFLAVALNINYQRKELLNTAVSEKLRLAETLNEVIFSPVLSYRYRTTPAPWIEKVLLSEAAKFREVVFLKVLSPEGRVLLSTDEMDIGSQIEEPAIAKAVSSRRAMVEDYTHQGKKLKVVIYPGYGERTILVGFSTESINATVSKTVSRSLAIGLGASSLVAIFLFFLLRGLISPIKTITSACQQIRKGNLEVNIDVKSKTELGELVDTFNATIRELKESRSALEEAKSILEIKVQARTRELKMLSENLEAQVQDRTKELRVKIAELEKFQKLTVGRELRMLELKKQIKERDKKLQQRQKNEA